MTSFPKKPLSIFGLVAINVIAIDSLRTLPLSAEYGFAAVFYYLLAAFAFFIPVALVAAELASGWPETGGIYIWVREAFGKRAAFITIWLQWFYNICWYPTIMSLIAATLAYVINPHLVNSKAYMLTVVLIVFWGATWLNCLGMRVSSWLSNFSAIVGTLVPMVFIIVLAVIWTLSHKLMQISFSARTFFPNMSNIQHIVLFISILYGLVGMEMSASHARDVQNPQRDYPKAVLYSIVIILSTLVLGSLAISIVVPAHQINIIAGLLQAFIVFFKAFHMGWFMPILAILIMCGAFGGAAAWMLGPSKGMLMAARDGSLPASLGKMSSRNAPVRLLMLQGAIFTVLCSVFILMPSFNAGFWVLTAITAILALLVYVVMFPAAIVLRYKFPDQERPFKIPGGKLGIWIIALLGLITTLFAVVVGFFPPAQIPVGNLSVYETLLVAGVVIGCFAPLLLSGNRRCKQVR